MLDLQEPISERYHIQQLLHHGFMSDVYRAYDQHLQCDVAIKLVCHDQTESRLRLQSEIHTLSSLTHDHILPILDHGEYGMYHYLVMPYCKQGTLLNRISQEILTEEEAGEILIKRPDRCFEAAHHLNVGWMKVVSVGCFDKLVVAPFSMIVCHRRPYFRSRLTVPCSRVCLRLSSTRLWRRPTS